MSLLLEALNKADKDKQKDTPSLQTAHTAHTQTSARPYILVAAIIISMTALAVAGYKLFATPKLVVTNAQAASNTVSISQDNRAPSSTTQVTPTSNKTSLTQTSSTGTSATVTAEESDEEISTLYKVNNINSPNIDNSNSTPEPPTSNLASSKLANYANLPDLHDLPPEFLNKIPSLNYTEHHYSVTGGNVVINGQIKHQADSMVPGVVIEKILEDGLILHSENYSFKMRALNSWVNM